MATWTTPSSKTWNVGALENAVDLNRYHRDNLNVSLRPLAIKPTTEARVSDTTFRDDQHLWFYLNPNEQWYVQFYLRWNNVTSTTPDIAVTFTAPSSTTFNLSVLDPFTNYHIIYDGMAGVTIGASGIDPQSVMSVFRGPVIAGSVGGRFQFQWSQSTSSANETQVMVGSAIFGIREVP